MDGAVIYFKLNGNSNDSSGNGFNGTDTTITYTNSGKMGGAAQFNDSGDNKSKIDYGKGTIRDNIVHLTVMAWVYIHSFVTGTGGNRRLYTKGLANAGHDIYFNSSGDFSIMRASETKQPLFSPGAINVMISSSLIWRTFDGK